MVANEQNTTLTSLASPINGSICVHFSYYITDNAFQQVSYIVTYINNGQSEYLLNTIVGDQKVGWHKFQGQIHHAVGKDNQIMVELIVNRITTKPGGKNNLVYFTSLSANDHECHALGRANQIFGTGWIVLITFLTITFNVLI